MEWRHCGKENIYERYNSEVQLSAEDFIFIAIKLHIIIKGTRILDAYDWLNAHYIYW